MLSFLFYNTLSFVYKSNTTKSFEQAIINRYVEIINKTDSKYIFNETLENNISKSAKAIDIPGFVQELCQAPDDQTMQILCNVLTISQSIDTSNTNTYVIIGLGVVIIIVTIAILVYYIYRKTCSQTAQEKAIIRRQQAREINLEKRLSAGVSPHTSTTNSLAPSTLTLESSSNSLDNYDDTKK